MRSALLANATDISLWAVRRDAQDTMPQLLRRLVHATSRKILRRISAQAKAFSWAVGTESWIPKKGMPLFQLGFLLGKRGPVVMSGQKQRATTQVDARIRAALTHFVAHSFL